MASDKKINYEITANPEGFSAAMQQTAKAASAAQQSIQRSFSQVGDAIGQVQGKLLGMAALLTGGALFKEQVTESAKWTGEANKLGKALGITATEASVLNVALGDIYTDADTMVAASTKLSKALGENEDKFKKLGIETRNTDGSFRPMMDIMLATNQRLLQFREGTDRNVEGIRLYGKSWGEIQPVLRLTTGLMEESKKKAEELGLVVGAEDVQAAARYKAAMNDVGDVVMAVKKAVGDALMPVLTGLGKEFAETGPDRVRIMVNVMKVLIAVFEAVKLAVTIVWETIKVVVTGAVVRIMTMVEVAQKVMAGDFSGAKEAWTRGMGQVVNTVDEAIAKIVKRYDEARTKLADLMEGAQKTPSKQKNPGSEAAEGKSTKDAGLVAQWKNELEQIKIERDGFFKNDLAQDLTFWESKVALTRAKSKERMAVEREIFNLKKQLAQQDFAEEIAQLNFQKELVRGNAAAQLEIERQKAVRIKETYGETSKQFAEAQREVQRAKRVNDEELRRLDELRIDAEKRSSMVSIELRRENLRMLRELGQISASQEIADLRALKEEEYQLEKKAAEDKMALIRDDVAARRAAKDEIRNIEEKWKLEQKKSQDEEILANKKRWEEMLSPVMSAFNTSIKGIILGTTTWRKAMSNLFQSFLGEFINMGVKMVTRWLLNETIMTTTTQAQVAARSLAEQSASGAGMAMQAAEIVKKIFNAAAETFAGVFGFMSSFMGPYAAAPAAASMATVAAVAGSVAFAEDGYDVPAGVNPMTQLHQREMVLPANLADAVRGMAAGGGSAGAPTINITAFDSKDVKRFFERHGSTLVDVMRGQKRNFKSV